MIDKAKARAWRLVLQTAKSECDCPSVDRPMLASVIAYLTAKARAYRPPRPVYHQVPMFTVVGKTSGKYHCQHCDHNFGENEVGRTQSRRAYLTLHCPHCGRCWYSDNSQ